MRRNLTDSRKSEENVENSPFRETSSKPWKYVKSSVSLALYIVGSIQILNQNSVDAFTIPQHQTFFKSPQIGHQYFSTYGTTSSSLRMVEKAVYEVDANGQPVKKFTSNAEAEESSTVMKKRIVKLLSDDQGEEDDEVPDYSEEAANEIADKKSYSRISEEAKWKANSVMQKNSHASSLNSISTGTLINSGLEPMIERKVRAKPLTKVMASVKETGGDSMSEYIKSMGQHELLPQESELLLGRHIQLLVKWEGVRSDLEKELERPPTFAEWSSMLDITVPELKKQIRRSQRAKAALIEANLRLVVTVARQTVKQGKTQINFQDACQEGIIGLSIACDKFDPEKGFRFSTYAVWWIRREVQKNVNQQGRTVRLPASAMKKINDIRINERLMMNTLGRKPSVDELAEKCNLTVEKVQFYQKAAEDVTSLDNALTSKSGKGSNAAGSDANGKTFQALVKDAGPTPETIAEKEMLQTDVRRLIKTLSPKEQAVIRLRFGLDDGTPRGLDYIADKFKVGKERIRKVEAKALIKLRQPYRHQSVKCYISDL
jgi:RNA polymerase primary sigma factor